jgi:hypothetical protein
VPSSPHLSPDLPTCINSAPPPRLLSPIQLKPSISHRAPSMRSGVKRRHPFLFETPSLHRRRRRQCQRHRHCQLNIISDPNFFDCLPWISTMHTDPSMYLDIADLSQLDILPRYEESISARRIKTTTTVCCTDPPSPPPPPSDVLSPPPPTSPLYFQSYDARDYSTLTPRRSRPISPSRVRFHNLMPVFYSYPDSHKGESIDDNTI